MKNSPDKISHGLEEVGWLKINFRDAAEVPLGCSSKISSKFSDNKKDPMFSASFVEMFVSASKMSQTVFISRHESQSRHCAGSKLIPPLYTNVTSSSKSFDSLNINLQYGASDEGKTLKQNKQ